MAEKRVTIDALLNGLTLTEQHPSLATAQVTLRELERQLKEVQADLSTLEAKADELTTKVALGEAPRAAAEAAETALAAARRQYLTLDRLVEKHGAVVRAETRAAVDKVLTIGQQRHQQTVAAVARALAELEAATGLERAVREHLHEQCDDRTGGRIPNQSPLAGTCGRCATALITRWRQNASRAGDGTR